MDVGPRISTLDDGTAGSHPADLPVSFLRYSASYPFWPIALAGGLAACLILAAAVHWLFFVVAGPLLVLNVRFWRRVRRHFRRGWVSPAMMLSTKPLLIASWADLGRGAEAWPVIKIVRHRPRQLGGPTPAAGTLLATVGSARRPIASVRWVDLDPRPVQSACGEPSLTRTVLHGISPELWEELAEGLSKLPTPYQPGVYPVRGTAKDLLALIEQGDGFFAQSGFLVVRESAIPPHHCAFCDAPTRGLQARIKGPERVKQERSARAEALGCLLHLINPCLHVLVLLATRQRREQDHFHVGVCQRHWLLRRAGGPLRALCVCLGLPAGLLMLLVAAALENLWLGVGGGLTVVGSAVATGLLTGGLRLVDAVPGTIRLRGAHPRFLARLPSVVASEPPGSPPA